MASNTRLPKQARSFAARSGPKWGGVGDEGGDNDELILVIDELEDADLELPAVAGMLLRPAASSPYNPRGAGRLGFSRVLCRYACHPCPSLAPRHKRPCKRPAELECPT
jgi:hypothetical protein